MEYEQFNNAALDKEQPFPVSLFERCKDRINDNEVLLTVASDLNSNGFFEETWIVVTDKNIHIIRDSKGDPDISSYRLKDIIDIYLQNFHAVGIIDIKTSKGSYEIVRFTRRLRKKFYTFVEYFQKVLNNERFNIREEMDEREDDAIHAENRCKKCGTPMPPGSVSCPRCTSKRETFNRLVSYLKPYVFKIVLMLSTTLTFTLVTLLPPYLQKILIDDVIVNRKVEAIKWIILAILVTHVLQVIFQGLRSLQLSWLGQKITYDIRLQVYKHLQKLGMSYYDRRMTGAIMNRITGDTASIQGFIVNGIQEIIVQVFSLLIIIVILFSMNWKLAFIVMIPIPFIFFGSRFYSGKMRKVYRRVWRRRSNLSAVLGGAIPGIKVVKAFTQEEHEADKFHEALSEYFREEILAARHQAVFYPLLSLTTTLGTVLIWGFGSYQVILDYGLSLGTLTAFIGYMARFYHPVQVLSNLSGQYQMATTAAERVFEVLDQQPEQEESATMKIKEEIIGDIVFKDVRFRYNVDEEILKGINLHIKPGEMVGLVGSSGSGKSTLVNLIPRFYEVTEGQLLIDGKEIREYDITSLRGQIGVVLQEPFLFFGTIAENIAYGRPDASMDEIVWASKAANAHKFIMNFPDAYDTIVGERGVGLSGGEKQRVSIARAILKDPKILILDEATSSVDTETEKLIQEAIDFLIKDRTTIAIAHRLSTLKNANKIVVMDEGSIAEEGPHDVLAAKEGGAFRRLIEIQSEIAKTQIV